MSKTEAQQQTAPLKPTAASSVIQANVLALTLSGRSASAIARKLGCDRGTVAKIQNEESFQSEVFERMDQMVSEIGQRLVRLSLSALNYMHELIEDDDADPALRQRASEFVVSKTADAMKAEQLSRRLDRLDRLEGFA